MSEHNPDKWAIVKYKTDQKTWYKVLGSWYGGYLDGDSWRLSSGLEQIEEDDNFYLMKNYSGSVYRCHKEMEGMHLTSAGIYNTIKEAGSKVATEVSLIDVEQFRKETEDDERS